MRVDKCHPVLGRIAVARPDRILRLADVGVADDLGDVEVAGDLGGRSAGVPR